MKKNLLFLMSFFWVKTLLSGVCVEVTTSYDYYRGIPDGSWNGNTGGIIGLNSAIAVFEGVKFQLGGSYGVFNWDGRGNVVFSNPKKAEQVGLLTVGLSSSYCEWNAGIVYDRLFTNHYSIYALNPSVDQFRFRTGYVFCSEEVGFWGTIRLTKSHHRALGVPVNFKAINQINLFWKHEFENCSYAMVWIGMPYGSSLRFPHGKAGNGIFGFSFRAPLMQHLFLDGIGSYMFARHSHGVRQSRNYGSNISIGITYIFEDGCCNCEEPYMEAANHSNFFVESNVNQ
jgi:hypothetical protein